jgi:hypothetical protein
MGCTLDQLREMEAKTERAIKNSRLRRAPLPAGATIEPPATIQTPQIAKTSPKRVRQGEKPPNKLESDWRRHMEAEQPGVKFRAQAMRFRLANGAWYKPDLMAWLNCRVICWETKGPKQAKNVARGILTIKFAAAAWPEVCFILVWRENGVWQQQEILP